MINVAVGEMREGMLGNAENLWWRCQYFGQNDSIPTIIVSELKLDNGISHCFKSFPYWYVFFPP